MRKEKRRVIGRLNKMSYLPGILITEEGFPLIKVERGQSGADIPQTLIDQAIVKAMKKWVEEKAAAAAKSMPNTVEKAGKQVWVRFGGRLVRFENLNGDQV